MDQVQTILCQRLALLRANEKLSRKHFADKLGLLPRRYFELEEGIGEQCSIAELGLIAERCAVSCDYLLGIDSRTAIWVQGFTCEQLHVVNNLCSLLELSNIEISKYEPMSEDVSLNRLGFDARIVNALERANILTAKQLLNITPADLNRIRNLGVRSIRTIVDWQEKTCRELNLFPPAPAEKPKIKRSKKAKRRTRKHFVEKLDLASRPKGALLKAGIRTEKELLALTEEDIENMPGLGKKGKEEVRAIQGRLSVNNYNTPENDG